MIQRKVCVITATRAEYYLLKPLLDEINNDNSLELQLIITGAHLLKENEYTCKDIQKDFTINQNIIMDLQDDSNASLLKTMSKLQTDLGEVLNELQPDLLVILGDRYEMLSVATTALMLQIPIAHIHGGETTEGAIDEAIRHSITKMSHLHFTSTEIYRKRVIQLGENPEKVFNFGSLGVESIHKLKLLNKEEFEDSINFKLGAKNLLITFHPQTLSTQTPKEQFSELLNALDTLQDTKLIFTKANADSGGATINTMIDAYVLKNKHTSICFTSLGQLRYFSALQYVDALVGNSSSGIIEVPSFKIATINIGDRQKGRVQAKSIINSEISVNGISNALEQLYTDSFKLLLQNTDNPHKGDNTASNIKNVIKNTSLDDILIKEFHDI